MNVPHRAIHLIKHPDFSMGIYYGIRTLLAGFNLPGSIRLMGMSAQAQPSRLHPHTSFMIE